MNKLSKTQRDQLLGVILGIVAVMVLLWEFGIAPKQVELDATRQTTVVKQQKLLDAEAKLKRGDLIGEKLRARTDILHKREATLAPDRDGYAWLIENSFIQSRKGVNIDFFSQPEISDNGIIPRFPYRWATFHLKGTGYYYDLGQFFADLEKSFPSYHIQNPVLSANVGAGLEPEKLSVSFDLVVPVVSSATETK